MTTFTKLWNNHPTVKGDAPLLDTVTYENQCVINVSAAMMRSGYDLKSYRGTKSWQKEGTKYPLRAEEYAVWLTTAAAKLPNPAIKFQPKQIKDEKTGKDVFDALSNKTGIIFFKDYWGPGMNGDHIDLWNGARMTARSSWFRVQLGISLEGYMSDYLKAKAVWFWHIP